MSNIKNKLARFLAAALACLSICSAAACADTDASVTDPTTEAQAPASTTLTATEAQTDPTHDKNGYLLDDIPVQNHNDKTVTVLVYKQAQNHILPEEEGVEMIQSAVYMRSAAVEERLGIKFDPIGENASWNDQTTFIAKATMAGENYDLIASYSLWPQVLAVQGHLYDLNQEVYPKLDMPWWCESVKDWEQNGKLFFVTSNSSVKFIGEAEAVFANIKMLENRGAPDPTQYVLDGTWTLEKLHEMSALFHSDSPSDGNSIPYGIVVDDQSRLDMFFYGSGMNTVRIGEDGVAYVCIDEEKEKLSSFVDTMIAMLHRNEALIADNSVKTMLDSQTAFMCCCISHVTKMDDATYTALPVPKYDEAQSSYRTVNTNGFDVWCIPIVAKDPSLSATVMEAIASEDYRSVSPYYYDQYLKIRYSNNDIGSRIYDIIRNSVYVDFGRISAVNLGVTEGVFRNPIRNGKNNVSSTIKMNVNVWTKKLQTILDSYSN